MTLKSLEKVGKSLGLTFTKNHTKAERTRRILTAYASQDVSAQDTEVDSSHDSQPSDSPPPGQNLHERKPEFERLCQEDTVQSEGGDIKMDGRGGAREGAGCLEGMTKEVKLYSKLPQFPHPAIQHFLEMAFQTWAARSGCPEVALTSDQAFALALPYTQAAYLAGILDYIPAWAVVGIELIWTTWNMVSIKASLARDAAAKRKEAETEREENKVAA